jgi:acyl carrier protein
MSPSDIQSIVKAYLLAEFLEGEDPARLTETEALITGKLLDSIALLKLVSFLEDRFGIAIAPHEADADNLDDLGRIARFVTSKLAPRA